MRTRGGFKNQGSRIKPPYAPESRVEAVRLIRSGGRTQSQVARDVGVSTLTLRSWLRQTGIGAASVRA